MKKISLALVFMLVVQSGFSQSVARKAINKRLDSINSILARIPSLHDDSLRLVQGERALQYMQEIMMHPSSWGVSLDPLKDHVKILYSPDKTLRIITWGIPLIAGDYKYYGVIQRYDKKKKTAFFYLLQDKSSEIPNPRKKVLTPSQWYGCIYYDIREFNIRNRKYYVLLGSDPADDIVNRKILDVLYFQGGKPKFGYDMPQEDGKIVKRLIFAYNNQSYMALDWNNKNKMYVFDHLSPSEPRYKGLYQYYGPDMTYDALKLVKGRWQYLKDIDPKKLK